MATERVTERSDGASGGGTTVVKTGGSGLGAIVGIAVLAVVALIAVFLIVQANQNSPGDRVADAAGSIAASASRAADSAADATRSTADAVTPAPAQ